MERHAARGDVAGAVAALKRQPGRELLILGSAGLARTLRQHDLIDEYRLRVHPVILGDGKPLFRGEGGPTTLRLVESKTFSTGVVLLAYRPTTIRRGGRDDDHGSGDLPG